MEQVMGLAAANPFWVWAALGAGLLACEVATGSGWLLWPAASAGVVAVLSMLMPVEWLPGLGLFAVLTIASSLTARRFMPPIDPRLPQDINDTASRLLAQQGKAVTAFVAGSGRVFVDGKEWAAELDGVAELPAGAGVEVIAVSGAHLRVRPSA